MSFGRIAARGLGKLGSKFVNTKINPSRWVEGLGAKMGIRMRERPTTTMISPAVQAVGARAQVGLPQRTVSIMGRQTTLPATPNYAPAIDAVEGKAAKYMTQDYADRSLTGAGIAAHAIPWAGGVGLLGYKMLAGDGTESATDANGVKNPKFNEEMAKFRSKFQQDYLGGDKMFSSAKYRAVRDQSPWVRTAIEQIGKERYVAMKQALADGKISAMDMHSALTDAIAELGDEEVMKQAGTQPYVLPGLASSGQSKRVIVIAPMKGKKGNETSMQALKYAIREEQGQGEQQ